VDYKVIFTRDFAKQIGKNINEKYKKNIGDTRKIQGTVSSADKKKSLKTLNQEKIGSTQQLKTART
jgi:hypothetical protein